MNGNALAQRPLPDEVAEATTLDSTIKVGQILAKSGFFSDSREAAQCITKILAGRELGFGPVASMVGIYIVKSRVTLSANLIAAAIKRSGKYNFRVRRLDDDGCDLEFFEGKESIGSSVFTMADAKKAGLTGNETYTKFPRNMCYARAMSNGARWYCPDIFGGPVYTPEEMGATVDGETGEILNSPPPALVAPTRAAEQTPPVREAAHIGAVMEPTAAVHRPGVATRGGRLVDEDTRRPE